MRYICGYCYRAKFLCHFVAPCDDRVQEMREQAKDPETEETEASSSVSANVNQSQKASERGPAQ